MAFNASNFALASAYTDIKRIALSVKNAAISLRDRSAIGNITGLAVTSAAQDLRSAKLRMEQLSSVPGIANYAKIQEDDATYDVVAEYQSLIAALDATIAWIAANIPQSGGYLQTETLNSDGSITYRTFSPASTAGLRSALDGLISSIS